MSLKCEIIKTNVYARGIYIQVLAQMWTKESHLGEVVWRSIFWPCESYNWGRNIARDLARRYRGDKDIKANDRHDGKLESILSLLIDVVGVKWMAVAIVKLASSGAWYQPPKCFSYNLS